MRKVTVPTITGDVRPGREFQLTAKPTNMARSTFVAAADGNLIVTRRVSDLFALPDETPVVAHWHGEHRTDGFDMTVGSLKDLAVKWEAR
jgi:hypothetical protein